jgi:hypothetical protein
MRNYGLSIVAGGLFLATWIGAAISGWFEFSAEASAHHEAARVFGSDGYAWVFAEQTLQNWQSEFLVVALLVVFASLLIHRGSGQSRDSQDDRRRRVDEIARRVDALAQRQEG